MLTETKEVFMAKKFRKMLFMEKAGLEIDYDPDTVAGLARWEESNGRRCDPKRIPRACC